MSNMKIVVFLLLCLLTLDVNAVKVVFRLDDPSLQVDSVSMRAVKLFNEKQVPLSIAMIPCDSSEQPYNVTDSAYLKELQKPNVEIALHGYNHANINQHGEFGSIDFAETSRRIKLGKEILEAQLDKEIVTFIPPFNIINQYIPQAMLQNGLYILSSDMYDDSYEYGIQYFPETLDNSLAKKGFVLAAMDAIDNAWDDEVCVLMFHHYDFKDEMAWQRLSNVIDRCIANPNVELHTFRSLYESGERSSYHRVRANQMRSGLQKYILHQGVLHTTRLCWFIHILNALLYALIPLLLLIGSANMRSYYRNTIYVIVAFGGVVFFMLAFFHMMGPVKLLGIDILYVLFTLMLLQVYRLCVKNEIYQR